MWTAARVAHYCARSYPGQEGRYSLPILSLSLSKRPKDDTFQDVYFGEMAEQGIRVEIVSDRPPKAPATHPGDRVQREEAAWDFVWPKLSPAGKATAFTGLAQLEGRRRQNTPINVPQL
jgi:hypothetical protein